MYIIGLGQKFIGLNLDMHLKQTFSLKALLLQYLCIHTCTLKQVNYEANSSTYVTLGKNYDKWAQI